MSGWVMVILVCPNCGEQKVPVKVGAREPVRVVLPCPKCGAIPFIKKEDNIDEG